MFERSDMTGAALRLVADRGPQAVTVAALAREVGAPTGSIYHRYRSRDELLAKLLGTMQAPIAKFVRTLNEVPSKFVRTVAAVRDSRQAA